MADCYLCGKKLGIFSKVYHMDRERFCKVCRDRWPAERKHRALALLCQGGEPAELFSIPSVKCISPDYPKNRTVLFGNLAFTAKGVCFIQVAESQKADAGWGLAFGIVGAAIADSQAKRRAKEAQEYGKGLILDRARNFMELLNLSPRLMFIPSSDIKDITYGWFSGFRVKTAKGPRRFGLERGLKSLKPYRQQIRKYVQAIQATTGPVSMNDQANPYRAG